MNQSLTSEQIANHELIAQVLQQVLREKPSLLPLPTSCQCHLIDPNKFRILLWKDKDTYILKIADQKFVGVARQDRRGEIYWKFRDLYEDKETSPETKPDSSSEPSLKKPATKPLSEQTKEDLQAWAKYVASQPPENKSITAAEYLAKLRAERAIQEANPSSSEPVLKEIKENVNQSTPEHGAVFTS